MIIGITGAICAGKSAFAQFLADKYGFEVVNLLELFKLLIKEQKVKLNNEHSPLRQRRIQGEESQADDEQHSSSTGGDSLKEDRVPKVLGDQSTNPESESKQDQEGEESFIDDESFTFYYYQCKCAIISQQA